MISESALPSAPVTTKQQASGRVVARSVHGQYQLMLWTSFGGSGSPICFGTSKTGDYQPTVQKTSVNAQPGTGPAFVLMPDGISGYLVWVNTTQEIMISAAKANAKSPATWSLTGKSLMIGESRAAGGPAAMLRMQNGQLVLVIVWQDVNVGSMVYTQVAPGMLASQTQPAFAQLGDSCKDTPCLTHLGAASALAYTDASGNFNLVVDPEGGVDFDFAHRFTSDVAASTYGPAFVPLTRDMGYVLWSTTDGLRYQQIGINSDGDWQFNDSEGCSGILDGLVPAAAPSAQLVGVLSKDNVAGKAILVAAPSALGATSRLIQVAGLVPDLTPLPLPQAQLVTA